MAKPEFVLLGVVVCLLLSFIGYRIVNDHKRLGMALFMPLRFILLAPLLTGAMAVSDISASYITICAAWYMGLSFEIDRCHFYAGAILLVGVALHYYGA